MDVWMDATLCQKTESQCPQTYASTLKVLIGMNQVIIRPKSSHGKSLRVQGLGFGVGIGIHQMKSTERERRDMEMTGTGNDHGPDSNLGTQVLHKLIQLGL